MYLQIVLSIEYWLTNPFSLCLSWGIWISPGKGCRQQHDSWATVKKLRNNKSRSHQIGEWWPSSLISTSGISPCLGRAVQYTAPITETSPSQNPREQMFGLGTFDMAWSFPKLQQAFNNWLWAIVKNTCSLSFCNRPCALRGFPVCSGSWGTCVLCCEARFDQC